MKTCEKILIIIIASLLLIPFIPSASADRTRDGINISKPSIEAVVDNSFLTVTTSVSLENGDNATKQYNYHFKIPGDAFLTNLSAEMDGLRYYGRVKGDEEAQQDYQDAVESGKSAIKIEKYTVSSFGMTLNLLPEKPMRVSFTYNQFLVKELGGYRLALNPEDLMPTLSSIDTSVSIRIDSPTMITKADVMNLGDGKIDYDGANALTCSADVSPQELDRDIVLTYGTQNTGSEGIMRFHRAEEITYFLHTFAPGQDDLGDTPLQKDIIFIVDTSGSMAGDKIKQTKDAFHYIVGELSEEYDRFNIISFSSSVRRWKGELQVPTSSVVREAKDFIGGLEASGGTNIHDALETGLGEFDDDAERMKILVFLTDGNPTSGDITAPEAICTSIYNKNTAKTSIFSLGIGNDVDFGFLEKLSFKNYARAYKIYEGGDISEQIGHFYDTISTPLIFRLNLEYGNAVDVYHRHAPYLFNGQEHLVLGKVADTVYDVAFGGTGVTVNGSSSFGGGFTPTDDREPFIATLWAFMHIRWCQEQVKMGGGDYEGNGTAEDHYEAEITHTAVEHQIVTEYTTMIVVVEKPWEEPEEPDEPEDDDTDDDSEDAKDGSTDDPTDRKQDNGGGNDLDYREAAMEGTDNPPGGTSKYDDDDVGDDDGDGAPNGGGGGDRESNDSMCREEKGSNPGISIIFLGLPIIIVLTIIIILVSLAVVKSRRQRDRAMKGMRRDIFEYIRVNPGEHMSRIMHEFDMSPSSTTYHLDVLEKTGNVLSHKGTKYKRYYANVDGVFGGQLRDAIGGPEYKQIVSVLKSGTTNKIVKHILDNPGCTQKDIAKEVGINASTVNWHIKKLNDSDIVDLARKGKYNCYTVKDSDMMSKAMEVLNGNNT